MSNKLWAEWHTNYSEQIQKFCVAHLTEGDKQAADLISAIAIEKGVKAVNTNQIEIQDITGYLIRIATNIYIDEDRRSRAHPSIAGDIYELDLNIANGDLSVEELTEQKMFQEKIRDALSVLDPAFGEVGRARFIDELSYEEIADRFNISIGTVKSRISRTKGFLSSIL